MGTAAKLSLMGSPTMTGGRSSPRKRMSTLNVINGGVAGKRMIKIVQVGLAKNGF